jgi:hypothetical protein
MKGREKVGHDSSPSADATVMGGRRSVRAFARMSR